MKIAVYTGSGKFDFPKETELLQVSMPFDAEAINGTAAFFNLDENEGSAALDGISVPVFLNNVAGALKTNAPVNAIRFNGWPGFQSNGKLEYAGEDTPEHHRVAEQLGLQLLKSADVPGMLSARIVAMIINEAFFALGENVSTEEEIDVAMKLGTNYPFGPFEWCEKIGAGNVLNLLNVLSSGDEKYAPAPALKSAAAL